MTGDEQLVADAVDTLEHAAGDGLNLETFVRGLVEEARERGREDVRAYARQVVAEKQVRRDDLRHRASAKLVHGDDEAAATLAHAARVSSVVIAHLDTVARWTP